MSFDDGRREAIEEGSCSSGTLVLLLGAFLIPPMTDDKTYNEHNDNVRSNPSARHDVDDDNDDDDFRRLSLTSRASDAMCRISLGVCVGTPAFFCLSLLLLYRYLNRYVLLILFRPRSKYRQKISRMTLANKIMMAKVVRPKVVTKKIIAAVQCSSTISTILLFSGVGLGA